MREMKPEQEREQSPVQDKEQSPAQEKESAENLESEMRELGDGKTGLWGEVVSGEEKPEEEAKEEAYYEARRQERHARIMERRKRRKRNRRIGGIAAALILAAAAGLFFSADIREGLKETGFVQKLASLGSRQTETTENGGKKTELEETEPTSAETTAGAEETEAISAETTAEAEETEASSAETAAEAEETEASSAETTAAESTEASSAETTSAPEETSASETDSVEFQQAKAEALAAAENYAVQYDYDSAIQVLKSVDGYKNDKELRKAIKKYKKIKASCVEYPLDQITHVFFHTLINDTSRAFDGDYKEGGYNQVMTTVSEFNKIIQILYDKGYVLVSPHDMATVNEDGTMSEGTILLPEGKIPFVLSQDDVSYYHYMDGDGFASKLVLDENGDVKAEYVQADGTTVVGDYDLVPILDTFIKAHPDFSYHGRKGILAMTGYDGVFGYRTDIAYKTGENLQDDQKTFLENHPDFDYEQEVADATAVADAMKANGWEFASHTWGHRNATTCTAEELEADNEKWEAYVKPILGDTDMIIFAFGGDIGDWQEYTLDNEKFAYFKSRGYNYYCNVDSSQYWVQITDTYFRQGRRNLDGYRMYYNPEMLSDLFDVADVWDSARPTPVPSILDTEGENG